MKQEYNQRPPWQEKENRFTTWVLNALLHLVGFCVLCFVTYLAFAHFFNTQQEYLMQKSTQKLETEYEILNNRYKQISSVIDNIKQRDENVFKILFEAKPYDFDNYLEEEKLENYEQLLTKNNQELSQIFTSKLDEFSENLKVLKQQNIELIKKTISLGDSCNYIPAIQPIINPNLTLLASSFGMRMHPFYRTLTMHTGIDFSVSENSRVFATADGVVASTSTKSSSSGNTITLDHKNGYKTVYNHLGDINVRKGQKVNRGDIIATSANTGLSFAPHLHYEVIKDGVHLDPINYFFKELNFEQYNKMKVIAQTGMQSLD